MAVFKCRICGFIYDEEKEGIPVSALKECPVCRQSPDNLELVEGDQKAEAPQEAAPPPFFWRGHNPPTPMPPWPPPASSVLSFRYGIHSAAAIVSDFRRKFTPCGTAQSLAVSGFPPFRPAGRSGI